MTAIRADRTLGEIVSERPSRAEVLEDRGLDYCCGGSRTLAEACREEGLDPTAVREALEENDASYAGADEERWDEAPLPALVDHIVSTHHAYLRDQLPRVRKLLRKVVRVHEVEHPELRHVQDRFLGLQEELRNHMAKEEEVLFPAVRELDASGPVPALEGPMQLLEAEHADAADALRAIRRLTDGFEPPEEACPSFTALYRSLADLERDLHRHVHEENNILFPRLREIVG